MSVIWKEYGKTGGVGMHRKQMPVLLNNVLGCCQAINTASSERRKKRIHEVS